MAGRLTHSDIEELLGAYALDAVDADEAAEVRAHLSECPRCSAEVAVHREVAAKLAGGGAGAPEGLWDRVAGALEEPPPALDLARVSATAGRSRPAPMRVAVALLAVAAAMIGVLGVLGVQVVRQENRVDELTAAMRHRALEQAAASASADARAQRVTLRSEDGSAYAEAVMQPNGSGYLVRHNLPGLSEDRTYQLWGKVDSRMVSLGVLGPKPGVVAFNAHGQLTMVAITNEQGGGATLPTTQPLVRGFVPDR